MSLYLSKHAVACLVCGLLLCMCALPARALGTGELIDLVIQAVEPQLAPAKPLIMCQLGGGSLENCVKDEIQKQTASLKQEAAKQAADALPYDPKDNDIAKIIAVINAAGSGNWAKVLDLGGPLVAKIVACAALPPGGKAVGCPVVEYVIDKNKDILNDAFAAVKGHDWWALVKLLGPETACNFIPGGEAKDLLCGVIGQALDEMGKFAKGGVKAGQDALISFGEAISGQTGHMHPAKYYELYWHPLVHVDVRILLNGGTPSHKVEFVHCVGYFDSHKASSASAEKWCGKMRDQLAEHVGAVAQTIKAAPAAYFASSLKPQASRLAIEYYHLPANDVTPQVNLWPACLKDLQQKVSIPGKLPTHYVTASPYTAHEWACKKALSPLLGAVATHRSLISTGLLGKLGYAGCTSKKLDGSPRLYAICNSYESYAACKVEIAALGAQGDKHCGLDGLAAGAKLAKKVAAELGTKRCGVTPGSPRNVECTRPWKQAKCKELVMQFMDGVSIGWAYEVTCTLKDDPAFTTGKKQASDIVFKLNGGAGSKYQALGTKEGEAGAWKPATSDNCKTTWDPLSISCKDAGVMAQHQVSLPACQPDPNKDGADMPCLVEKLMAPQLAPGKLEIYQGPLQGGGTKVFEPPPPLAPTGGIPPPPMPVQPAGSAPPVPTTGAPPPAPAMGPPPVLAPGPPTTQGGAMATPQVPGCASVAGLSGQYACATREAFAGCERLRISGAAGVRQCQSAGGRMRSVTIR